MKHSLRLLAIPLLSVTAFASTPLLAQSLVIDRVTIVDVSTGKLTGNRAIVIADGKIARIAATGTVKGGGRHVDGKGAFVVPGYNDMHAHNLNTESPETSLPVMLASGITGFRQMAGAPPLLAARAKGTLGLPADSPALLAMPGTIIAGPAFADPAAVTAEINRQKAQGADFIKVIDLPRATFLVAADAARAVGLPFAGHLPPSVDTRDALAHGMASIEHLGPGISLLINCSRDEAAVRAILNHADGAPHGIDFSLPPAQLKRLLANPMMLAPPPAFLLMRRVLATYDDAKCRAFAADVAKNGTWMVPTLTRLEAMDLGNAPELRDSASLAFVPADTQRLWREVGNDFDTKLTAEQRQTLADLFAAQLRLAKLFDASGVKMMAGTDFGGQWVAPNALHREFDLLARSGVPPLHILQMATLGPARFLKREAVMGSVEAGRNADLVLLSADPMKDTQALHAIAGVVRGGRYLDRAELDAIQTTARTTLH
ncbi:amidohydrolase family protein [Sphingomonas sp.]|uniref:amidohydrolase family protein n=1 Tax=Sphingomonas sp. TaxID=28214 RepID=UPI0025E48D43|nr:amidohydrolase family protein [Sphingomonas sp.]